MKAKQFQRKLIQGVVEKMYAVGGMLYPETKIENIDNAANHLPNKAMREQYTQLALESIRRHRYDWQIVQVAFTVIDGEEGMVFNYLPALYGSSKDIDTTTSEHLKTFLMPYVNNQTLVNYSWIAVPSTQRMIKEDELSQYLLSHDPFNPDTVTRTMLQRTLAQ